MWSKDAVAQLQGNEAWDAMSDLGERMSSLETKVESMSHQLFGNGNEGELDKMRRELDTQRESIAAVDLKFSRYLWIAVGIYVGWAFLTSNGVVSLAHVLQALAGK